MAYIEDYSTIDARELLEWVVTAKHDGWQFVQMLAARTDEGTDLVYTLRKGDAVWNRTIVGVKPEDEIPSVTDTFLAAFVFENEAHDLFGVNIKNIAIDFGGKFYDVAVDTPMSVISPELAAEKKKAAKIAAAKAAKAKKAAAEAAAKKAAEQEQAAQAEVTDGDWWPKAAVPEGAANAAAAPAPMPGEVEEGGEWWPREAPNGEEAR